MHWNDRTTILRTSRDAIDWAWDRLTGRLRVPRWHAIRRLRRLDEGDAATILDILGRAHHLHRHGLDAGMLDQPGYRRLVARILDIDDSQLTLNELEAKRGKPKVGYRAMDSTWSGWGDGQSTFGLTKPYPDGLQPIVGATTTAAEGLQPITREARIEKEKLRGWAPAARYGAFDGEAAPDHRDFEFGRRVMDLVSNDPDAQCDSRTALKEVQEYIKREEQRTPRMLDTEGDVPIEQAIEWLGHRNGDRTPSPIHSDPDLADHEDATMSPVPTGRVPWTPAMGDPFTGDEATCRAWLNRKKEPWPDEVGAGEAAPAERSDVVAEEITGWSDGGIEGFDAWLQRAKRPIEGK